MSDTIITEYDIVFALHTGVTIMMQQLPEFDNSGDGEIPFTVADGGDKGSIHIEAPGGKVTIDNVKSAMLAEIKGRAFFMIYEFDGEDMARCTPCALKL